MDEERKDPEIDESLLTPLEKKEMGKPLFPKKAFIFFLVIIGLMVICLIVILAIPK